MLVLLVERVCHLATRLRILFPERLFFQKFKNCDFLKNLNKSTHQLGPAIFRNFVGFGVVVWKKSCLLLFNKSRRVAKSEQERFHNTNRTCKLYRNVTSTNVRGRECDQWTRGVQSRRKQWGFTQWGRPGQHPR